MKLSEKLKQYDSCGYFGRSLQGLPEMADALELRLDNIESKLASALAANQVMREALQKISDGEYGEQDRNKECKHDKYHWEDCEQCIHEVVDAALAIKPGDIALVEVAAVDAMETGVEWNPIALGDVKSGGKLYVLKQKEGE